MEFSTQLTVLRAEKNISLQKLADAIGVSKTHIWQLEKGITEAPALDIVKKLADFFNVSVGCMLGENIESPNADPMALAMFRKFSELDEMDQKAILQMTDAMLKKMQSLRDENKST